MWSSTYPSSQEHALQSGCGQPCMLRSDHKCTALNVGERTQIMPDQGDLGHTGGVNTNVVPATMMYRLLNRSPV